MPKSIQLLIGQLIAAIGLLFIGPSPLLTSILGDWHTQAASHDWYPYAASVVLPIGVGLVFPSIQPLMLRSCVDAGLPKDSIAGPVASLQVFIPALASFFGLLISGPLISSLGVAFATLIPFGLNLLVAVLNVWIFWPDTSASCWPDRGGRSETATTAGPGGNGKDGSDGDGV